jgi:flagella basal body P-ring formation protein FlgA
MTVRRRARTGRAAVDRLGAVALSLLLTASFLVVPRVAEAQSLRERVEREAIRLAELQVPLPDRFEVISSRFGGADPAGGEAVVLELHEVQGPNASGSVQVHFRLLVDGMPRGQARASVRGRVVGPALQARNVLPRGEPIDPEEVELVESDLTRLAQPPLRQVDELANKVPIRTLGSERVLTADLLTAAPVVFKGQTVELHYRKSRLSVRALATALRSGAPGERVPAKNRSSGVVVHGTVQSDGTLIVEGGNG